MFGIHDQAVLLFPAVVYWGEVFATAKNELGGSPELVGTEALSYST